MCPHPARLSRESSRWLSPFEILLSSGGTQSPSRLPCRFSRPPRLRRGPGWFSSVLLRAGDGKAPPETSDRDPAGSSTTECAPAAPDHTHVKVRHSSLSPVAAPSLTSWARSAVCLILSGFICGLKLFLFCRNRVVILCTVDLIFGVRCHGQRFPVFYSFM